jgi:chromosome segregation ATPase
MKNEVLFYTQIFSIISYIGALFYVYRVLVSQKDSTIELLKEKNDFLKNKIDELKENSPGILVERLTTRINGLENELIRLSKDEEKNQKVIEEKEKQLEEERNKLNKLNEQIENFKDIANEYFCPNCGSPLLAREYHTEVKQGIDIDHEFVEYECGREEIDGNVISGCSFPENGNLQVYFCFKGDSSELEKLKKALIKRDNIMSFEIINSNYKYTETKKMRIELFNNFDKYSNFEEIKEIANDMGIVIFRPR